MGSLLGFVNTYYSGVSSQSVHASLVSLEPPQQPSASEAERISNREFGKSGNAESNRHYQLQEEKMWWPGSEINKRISRKEDVLLK